MTQKDRIRPDPDPLKPLSALARDNVFCYHDVATKTHKPWSAGIWNILPEKSGLGGILDSYAVPHSGKEGHIFVKKIDFFANSTG